MNKTALPSLPVPWQTWINDNLARGCEPATMAQIMVRDGKFEATLARAAIEEARSAGFGHLPAAPVLQPLPRIDTASNVVRTPDRDVQILAALRAPRIVVLGSLLSDEECDALIAYGRERLVRSPVVSESDGNTQLHAHRTSRGAMLQRAECELVARIEARIAALVQWPAENGEGMQLLQYEKGNEYRPHYDWFDASRPGPRKHLERGGQRVATVVMYLSDVEQGGGTSFPNVGLQVQPKKGSAVFFANTDAYRVPDPQTLHAGEPVVQGVKYIATKWLRERAYV
ncbi:MAG TPA: 2OG-Fe(II) oxygenase [Noviherbaspirillum sp.]|uniref:2OG-Fe(II) oxygenase n=1 Tax=Noviherbaspirillum sp. TaxID=1926288 RepID=UPI002D3E10F1|nr:2OG-Fe(II) oxygenase [Noviherbaspirillum sp.]HYD95846.1 2OG-Fe(II) oxygenase [Noviherbaspirillum sp.]